MIRKTKMTYIVLSVIRPISLEKQGTLYYRLQGTEIPRMRCEYNTGYLRMETARSKHKNTFKRGEIDIEKITLARREKVTNKA